MKKTAIVTGASSGFGLLTVNELAKRGFKVIATMRDLSKSKQLLEKSKQENVFHSILFSSSRCYVKGINRYFREVLSRIPIDRYFSE